MSKIAGKILNWIKRNILILLFFIGFFFIDLWFRFYENFPIWVWNDILYTGFFVLAVSFIMSCMSNKGRTITSVIILLIEAFFAIAQILHYAFFSSFFSVSKATMLGRMFEVKGEMATRFDPETLILFIPVLIVLAAGIVSRRNRIEKSIQKRNRSLIMAAAMLVCNLCMPVFYADSDANIRSEKYLYSTLYNKTKAIRRLGLLSYTFKDITLSLAGKESGSEEQIDAYLEENGYTHEDNAYTGIFEGKNLILILCETFSSKALDPEITPLLYQMSREGFSFENHYAPIYQEATADSEFMSLTSMVPSIYTGPTVDTYTGNSYPYSLPNMLDAMGYSCNSFHSYRKTFYNRNQMHTAYGFDYFYDWDDLDLPRPEGYQEWQQFMMDTDLFDAVVEKTVELDSYPFFDFVITLSGHGSYSKSQRTELADDIAYIESVKGEAGEEYTEEELVYFASQHQLEMGVELLVEKLEEQGLLEDTVIAFYGDHYPYTMTDAGEKALYADEQGTMDIYKTPFVIWNSEMEEGITVTEPNSSYDIYPTIANLFNIDLAGKYIVGTDLLSDEDPIVIFEDLSWISSDAYYDSTLETVEKYSDITDEEVAEISNDALDTVVIGQAILESDYEAAGR